MSNLPVKRDEIHPVNPYRPPSAPSAFRLVKWRPIYDLIVAGHIIGKQNKELAEEFDFSTVHIGNILRADRAQELIAQAHTNIRTSLSTNVEEAADIHSRIREKALKRTEEFLDNEEIAKNSPFAYMNTIKSFTGISAAPAPATNINIQHNQQTVNNISEKSVNRLSKALEISEGMYEIEEDE